jgi:hypothetical protein
MIVVVLPADPATAVTRPKVAWQAQKRTTLHPLEFAAHCQRPAPPAPNDHALVDPNGGVSRVGSGGYEHPRG